MAATKLILLCLAGIVTSGATAAHRDFNLSESVNNFAIKFHKVVAQDAGSENVITSPLAIQLLLSLYATGTDGSLREELAQSLHLGDFDKLRERFGSVSRNLSNYNPDTMTLASRIYANSDDLRIDDDFYQASRAYNVDLKQLKFSNPAQVIADINRWAAERSHEHIKEAVSTADIPAETALLLLNVIYFQNKWRYAFKAERTEEYDFFVRKDKSVKKQMMNINRRFQYFENEQLEARILEVPYQEEGFSMIIVLPDAVDGLQTVLEKLSLHGLEDSLHNLKIKDPIVHLMLPKFEIEHKLDLNTLLPKVGASKLFTEPATELINKPIIVSKALQKAFFKIDEEGAQSGDIPPPMFGWHPEAPHLPYHVDRPFFFAILRDDTVLLTGTYVH